MEKVDNDHGGIALPPSIQLTLVRATAHNSRKDGALFPFWPASVGKASGLSRICSVVLEELAVSSPLYVWMGYSIASILVAMAHLVT